MQVNSLRERRIKKWNTATHWKRKACKQILIEATETTQVLSRLDSAFNTTSALCLSPNANIPGTWTVIFETSAIKTLRDEVKNLIRQLCPFGILDFQWCSKDREQERPKGRLWLDCPAWDSADACLESESHSYFFLMSKTYKINKPFQSRLPPLSIQHNLP